MCFPENQHCRLLFTLLKCACGISGNLLQYLKLIHYTCYSYCDFGSGKKDYLLYMNESWINFCEDYLAYRVQWPMLGY